ncbi:MAG: C4-dicarboxylate ABC transporter substrate-binding protein [Betaproteobacteria bacterium]|nr:C4-dicarboxylate ABC transporter substrate-binding protein [Betaproteobacteria bacterium]
MSVRGERLSLRDMFLAWWPALLVVAIGFAIAWQFVEPAPPRSVVMVTGAEDGAYFAFAKQYGEVLARNDIELEIRSTSGSVENYHLLKAEDSDVDFGFVQGGIGNAEDAPDLLSLGGMYYEPVWVFHRLGTRIERLTQLKGRRIAIGPLGSGTRQLAASMLVASGVPIPHGPVANLTGDAAVKALQEGRADVVVLVASPQSRAVNALLHDRRVQLVSFSHAEAYTRHFPHLAAIVLPKGGIDLKLDIPPADVRLVATTADLVVRDDLHPAVVGLLAEAAAEVHGRPGLFQRAHEFPSSVDVDFPMSPDAARYYKSGSPFLQRYLPFWAANFVDRMIVLLVPIVALVIPLFRLLPTLYHWRIRSRIYRQYGELKFLEDEVINQPAAGKARDYLARLDSIEDRVNKLRIPLAYHEQMYTLRGHIDLVRAHIARLASA